MAKYINDKLIVLKVEKGIPIPEVVRNPKWSRKAKYRIGLERLEIGDSVFIPESSQPPQTQMHDLKMRFGRLFTYRIVKDEDGIPSGVRIWRVI
jgi:hypothetical protein